MAIAVKRIGVLLLALAAVVVPAIRTGTESGPTESERRRLRLLGLQQRRDIAVSRWVALAEREWSVDSAAPLARIGTPPIVLHGFRPGSESPLAVKIVSALWQRIGAPDSAVRVAVVIYNDSLRRVPGQRWWNYSGASITRSGGTTTCVTISPGHLVRDGTVLPHKDRLAAALAPCALLAAFGAPGEAVGPWLAATRYVAAGSTAWLNRTRSFIDGRGLPPWMTAYRDWGLGPGGGTSLLLSSGFARSIAELRVPPYELGVVGLRCLTGLLEACRESATDTTVMAGGNRTVPRDLTYSYGLLDRLEPRGRALPRPLAEWWLSDLIRDRGREQFARFWKSQGSLDAAFRNAFGEEIGAWTMRWAVRQWENSWWEKYRHQPRLLGVTFAPSWPLLAFGWTGIALMGAGWAARRRQVA